VAEVSARDAKLIQWLNEAYGKEKQLETALAAHIQLAEQKTHKKRLQQHLKETKDHARQVERRIKKLGGKAEAVDIPGPDVVGEGLTAVANVAGRAVAQAQGAVQAARGTSVQEKLLKNAKDELHEEAEEIANYTAIISLAEEVGDKDTAKIAKAILREEQRMYDFVAKQIPKLTKDVVKAEIPKEERASSSSSRSRSRSSSSRSSSSRSSGGSSRSRSSSSGSSSRSRSGSKSSSSRSSSSRSGGGSSRSSSSRSGSGSSRSSSSRSGSGSSRSSSSRSGGSSSRKSSSRSGGSSSRSNNSGSGSSSSRSRSSSSRSRSGGSKS
jgi:ferritin-like metal-binding protein YciE